MVSTHVLLTLALASGCCMWTSQVSAQELPPASQERVSRDLRSGGFGPFGNKAIWVRRCYDVSPSECPGIAKYGKCHKYLKVCPVSCGVCPGKECRNLGFDRECRRRAKWGHCQTQPEYMTRMCRKACKLCKPPDCHNSDPDRDCAWRAASNQCRTNPYYMKARCNKACGWCEDPAPPCEDKGITCPYMASKGFCDDPTYEKGAIELCPKSCNFCEAPDTPSPGCPGCPSPIDNNDPMVTSALTFALEALGADSGFQRAVKGDDWSVQSQVVAGTNYIFSDMTLAFTSCPTGQGRSPLDCPVTSQLATPEAETCGFTVFDQPWSTPRYQLLNVKCDTPPTTGCPGCPSPIDNNDNGHLKVKE